MVSSTQVIPEVAVIPKHIAIVMDGNGRWAKSRHLPRVEGHRRGVDAVRKTVQACLAFGVEHLTLFAFSSENWRRPPEEVSLLMKLFIWVLEREIKRLHTHGIRLRVIGDISCFEPRLQSLIQEAQALTANNNKLTLSIAANYGGRWDILQATRQALRAHPELAERPELLTEDMLSSYLSLADAPEPDLYIRTGGEARISNFLLWQLAYSEFYFTPTFWPDFDKKSLGDAILSYQQRERRFGRTSEQLSVLENAA